MSAVFKRPPNQLDLANSVFEKKGSITFHYTQEKDRVSFLADKKVHFVALKFIEIFAKQLRKEVERTEALHGIEIALISSASKEMTKCASEAKLD